MPRYRRLTQLLWRKFSKRNWFPDTLDYTALRYAAIESRMIEASRYVDFHHANFEVFSYEFASILRDCGSVFSSIMDMLVKAANQKENTLNIKNYQEWLSKEIENIHLVAVGIAGLGEYVLYPFRKENGKFEWWSAFTDVKHSEVVTLESGNLDNALHSLGAIAILYALMDTHNGRDIRLFHQIGFILDDNGSPVDIADASKDFVLFKAKKR
ncbi:MAG: hypothetical protein NWE91_05845 [Candidatus Bathyarchaeota archaeon]|nr:hypothetical protein [Candidatus Bathyarchaeota archaeon]